MAEIAKLFFKIGCLGFGGPIAVIGLLEEEFCERRKWILRERFSEMLAVCKLLPGPLAVQMSIYLGYEKLGLLGGLVAGVAFIFPSFILVLGLSYFYVHSGMVQTKTQFFGGLQAGALAVILLSCWSLAKPFRKSNRAWVIGGFSAIVIFFYPRWEPLVILFFGLCGAGIMRSRMVTLPVLAWFPGSLSSSLMGNLFWVCFKSGAFVFGTGLAIVPMLEGDVVGHYHWLTHSEFMDGLAIGQVTPGPVVITATFIGYKVAGFVGACLASFAIFFPAFFNILFFGAQALEKVSGTPAAEGFTAWAVPSVVGAIFGTSVRLASLTLLSPLLVGVFVLAMGIAIWLKPPAWVLIPVAGAVTYFMQGF